MSHISLQITSAQYTTYSVGTSYRGLLGLSYSYTRLRGITSALTDTLVLKGLTSSTVPTMPTSYTLGTVTTGIGTNTTLGTATFSIGATGATGSGQGPLASGTQNLVLSLTTRNVSGPVFTLTI